jgi:type I restriction enzyme S subunit
MLGGNVKKIGSMSSVIASLTNGHTPLRHDLSEGTVIFLTAEHVHDFRIEYESDKRILALHHKRELARTALTNGDILLTIKGKVGNCAIVNDLDKPTNINQDVALLSLRPGVDKHYVSAWLNSFLGKEMVNQFSTGGINPFLGLGNIRKLPFPIADVKDCAAIGAEVQELVEAGQKSLAESKRAFRQAVGLVESIIEG